MENTATNRNGGHVPNGIFYNTTHYKSVMNTGAAPLSSLSCGESSSKNSNSLDKRKFLKQKSKSVNSLLADNSGSAKNNGGKFEDNSFSRK